MKKFFEKIKEAFLSLIDDLKKAIKERLENRTLTLKAFLIKSAIFLLIFATLFAACIITVSFSVVKYTEKYIVLSTNADEGYDCILVLGALVRGDTPSDMLSDRLDVAIGLYFDGVAPVLLMSGDAENPGKYNEVATMKSYAMKAGVPEKDIICDPYGLSTYDCINRAKNVYKYSKLCIVTQEYHLSRALYIADKINCEKLQGCSADVRTYRNQFFRDVREILARFKDFFYVLVEKETVYTE